VTGQKKIFSPLELKKRLLANEDQNETILSFQNQIHRILNGHDPRILLIVGPCSIHNPDSAIEYATKLQALGVEVSDTFFIVMRTYFEKPRTINGWKGFLYDPHLNGTYDIETGLYRSRKLLLDLCSLKMATATEFLDPSTSDYISDLISWGCIGARTAESQIHRQLASKLNLPISFKNSTSGHVETAINGILVAKQAHTYLGINQAGCLSSIVTSGNSSCHLTLRGGNNKTNYDPESIFKALNRLEKANLPKRLLVDCSHGNSNRNPSNQSVVFQSIIHQIIEGNRNIKGMILESELKSGCQSIPDDLTNLQYGVSVTDACIDFKTTETLIRWAAEKLKKNETLTSSKICE